MSQSKRSKSYKGQINGHHSNSHNGKYNHKDHRSRIPGDIRHELDKALVGICDVWFNKIKPYLVRNNIKVHATRDYEEQSSQPVECSHCDPASSASSCSLCALLFSAANNIDSAVCQATGNHSPHDFAA